MRPAGSPHGTCHHAIYGLTCADFDALHRRSGGRCEICGKAENKVYRGVLCIDHDPRYGWEAVRGLVCHECNTHLHYVDVSKRSRSAPPQTYEYLQNAWFMTYVRERARRGEAARPPAERTQ